MRAEYILKDRCGAIVMIMTGHFIDDDGHLDYPEMIEHKGKSYRCAGRDFFSVNYLEVVQ